MRARSPAPLVGAGPGWGVAPRPTNCAVVMREACDAMTARDAERRLWQGLRRQQIGGFRFRRQKL